jgi:uncharacterized protein (DUF2141 family)
MKLFRKNILPEFFVVIVLAFIFAHSCANTTTPPMGGPKDTIPPVMLSVSPDSGSVAFPVNDGSVTIEFDEYVVVNEEQKNIFLSPPLEKKPETKIRGKSVIVTFPQPLDSSTTYTLNFGNSLADNNEGNLFPTYTYPFSTGTLLDSMYISGTISHAEDLLPADNVTIALYKDDADSNLYNDYPVAMARSDKFGYFVIRNIKPVSYYVYAFNDLNYNHRYDPDNEKIAFLGDTIIPSDILRDELPELQYVNEEDTLEALRRPSRLSLYLFKEESETQYIYETRRDQPRMASIKFAASNPVIDSIVFENIDRNDILIESNIRKDSIICWLTDTTGIVPDSLKFSVSYLKTDTLDKLVPETEEFSLALPKKKNVEQEEDVENEEQKRPDLLEFQTEVRAESFEQDGFRLVFDAPLSRIEKDSLIVTYTTSRGETSPMEYEISNDSLWSRIVSIVPKRRLTTGEEYTLEILPKAFTDIYGKYNDSLVNTVSLPANENLSTLNLDIVGVSGKYIVELTNVTRDNVYRSYRIEKDGILSFPYLNPGEYSVKITEDENGNGIADTGNLKQRKQPERIRLLLLPDGSPIINIRESTVLVQTVEINDIFDDEE